MDQVNGALSFLIGVLAWIFDLLMAVFAVVDAWLRALMDGIGVPAGVQTLVIVVVGVLFLIAVLRYLGGVFRVLLALILILLLVHLLLPAIGYQRP